MELLQDTTPVVRIKLSLQPLSEIRVVHIGNL